MSSPLKLVKFGFQRKQSTPWNRSWTCRVNSFTRTLLRSVATSHPALAPRESQPVCHQACRRYSNLKQGVGLHFSRCCNDDDLWSGARRFPEVFEISCGSGSSPELLPDVDGLLPETDKQTLEVHETIWSGTCEDETLPEIDEIAEDETSPEIHEIAGSGLAANLLLKLCQQNEMEKHRNSNDIKRQIETETRRVIWDIVEEICRDWKVSPAQEMMSTSVNGILGASHDFWDEDEEEVDSPRSFETRSRNGVTPSRTSSHCIFSETVVRGVVKNIGLVSFIDALSSVDSKGVNHRDCEVQQCRDIAGGVHVGKDVTSVLFPSVTL